MKWIMKLLGFANIFFTALGIAYFGWIMITHLKAMPGHPVRMDWIPFCLIAAVGLGLVDSLAFTGFQLMSLAHRAVPRAALVYIMEIVYFVFIVMTWMGHPSNNPRNRDLIIGFWGVAEGFLAPQLALYYPFVGLTLLAVIAIGTKACDLK